MDKDCTAVAVRPQVQGQLVLGSLSEFKAFAAIMVESKMFPDVKDVAQAIVKIQAGAELGLPPLYSLQHVSITSQGKLTIDAAIMANLIKRSGVYDYQILEHSGERCSIQMLQNGKALGQPVVFTLDDARRAGLADKDVWKKYPKNLLFARTISNAARWHCPHVIGNAYTPEEMSSAVGVQVQVIDQPSEPSRTPLDTGTMVEAVGKPPAAPTAERAGPQLWARYHELEQAAQDWNETHPDNKVELPPDPGDKASKAVLIEVGGKLRAALDTAMEKESEVLA